MIFSSKGSVFLANYNSELEQFIYEICYPPMRTAVNTYISSHSYSLDLSFSLIKSPDTAILEVMLLQYVNNVRIIEDKLLFDVILSCTVNLTEDSYKGLSSCNTSQWLIASCKAVITDNLNSFSVSEVRPFSSRIARKSNEQSVSHNIVLIIYKKDLDAEAASFLKKYYPDALKMPMAVPITEIAEAIGLAIIQSYRITNDFDIFGEIFFSKGSAEVYDLFKCNTYQLKTRRGTIPWW
ncbi:MAG: hypothetical protein ACERLG_02770 [Sedimentibacter sp.]